MRWATLLLPKVAALMDDAEDEVLAFIATFIVMDGGAAGGAISTPGRASRR